MNKIWQKHTCKLVGKTKIQSETKIHGGIMFHFGYIKLANLGLGGIDISF